jgi:hypothetical protein
MKYNSTATPLESVAQQFEHWRTTREKRRKIPDALWALVAPLMNQYGHNKIATALRLNHAQLKEHALPLLSEDRQKSNSFVECSLPKPVFSTESCVLEFTCKNGSAVKISGLTTIQMQPLISMLLGS